MAVRAMIEGQPARPLLQSMQLNDLQFLCKKLQAICEQDKPLPQNNEDMCEYIIDALNYMHVLQATNFTPGGDAEVMGTFSADGPRLHTGSVRGAKVQGAVVPEYCNNFISPSAQARRIGLKHYEDAPGAIRNVLDGLIKRMNKNPEATLEINGQRHPIKDLVSYGHFAGLSHYTYYSDPLLTTPPDESCWLFKQLGLLAARPEGCTLVPYADFMSHYLHVDRRDYGERVRTLAEAVMTHPQDFADLPKSEEPLVANYRFGTRQILHISPALVSFFERRSGLPQHLEKRPDTIMPISDMLPALGLLRCKHHMDNLYEFLIEQLLENPNRVVNVKTGKTLRQSMNYYRIVGPHAIYLDCDLQPFIEREWLCARPRNEEGKCWLTGVELCTALRLNVRERDKACKALQEVMQEVRDEHKEDVMQEGEPGVRDLIRRFTQPRMGGTALYMHTDAIESGLVTRDMVKNHIGEPLHTMAGYVLRKRDEARAETGRKLART